MQRSVASEVHRSVASEVQSTATSLVSEMEGSAGSFH